MTAKEKKNSGKIKDIFEDKDVRTISLVEAQRRLSTLFEINFNEVFTKELLLLNKTRNQMEHYTLEFNEEQRDALVASIIICYSEALAFFEQNIDNFQHSLEGARFVYTLTHAEADHIDRLVDQMMDE